MDLYISPAGDDAQSGRPADAAFATLQRACDELAAQGGRVKFVFLLTYLSWLNRIEAYFGKLRYFVLRGTYPQTPQQLQRQAYGFIRYHNRHCSTAQQAA